MCSIVQKCVAANVVFEPSIFLVPPSAALYFLRKHKRTAFGTYDIHQCANVNYRPSRIPKCMRHEAEHISLYFTNAICVLVSLLADTPFSLTVICLTVLR